MYARYIFRPDQGPDAARQLPRRQLRDQDGVAAQLWMSKSRLPKRWHALPKLRRGWQRSGQRGLDVVRVVGPYALNCRG